MALIRDQESLAMLKFHKLRRCLMMFMGRSSEKEELLAKKRAFINVDCCHPNMEYCMSGFMHNELHSFIHSFNRSE